MTDSGGIQEEACMLRVPCVTLRQNTERPETVEVGANVLVARDQRLAIEAIDRWLEAENYDWANPFGDGAVSKRVLDIVLGRAEPVASAKSIQKGDGQANRSTITAQNDEATFDKIVVMGLGYIGLPTAAMFAANGIKVVGVDIDPSIIGCINEGEIHIVEPDLDTAVRDVVARGYLSAALTPEAADAFIIAVPTPFKGDDHHPDTKYIEDAARAIGSVLQPGNLVVLESTSPVGTTQQMASWLAEARPDLTFPPSHGDASDVRIAHCPERVLPGKVMQELISNDRLIGGLTTRCSKMAASLYEIFAKGDCVETSARIAEMTKLTENSFRDVNIAFANELSMICDRLDIDVWEVIALANRHPRVDILKPGPGVGGHCIAVDPWFIVASAPEESRIIRAARGVNNNKPDWVLSNVAKMISKFLEQHPARDVRSVVLACYGLAFKPDIDDLRQSPALQIVGTLAATYEGQLLVVEPNITELPVGLGGAELAEMSEAFQRADIHLYLVAHREFQVIQRPKRFVIDTVGV